MIGRNARFYRMFHRIFDDGLAQSSFVLACDRTRLAVVVDPRRDVDVYVDLARQHQLTLALALETHVHADFVSGAHELSSIGAEIIAGPGAGLRIPHREARDGEQFRLGDVTLTALHTPGHTPEHISLLVDQPGEPRRVLTGDTLFVGAVGRPDLLGAERGRELAGDLYVSIYQKLLSLADDIEVHPGHGAGSLCGSGIGNELHSTIGQERRFNPMLQHRTQAAFIEAVLRDLPETPPYFAELKRLNQQGPPLLNLAAGPADVRPLPPDDAQQIVKQGATLIDLRQAEVFARGFPTGALNLGYGPKIGYWAGWVVPLTSTVVLLHDGEVKKINTARLELLRIGIDNVVGYVDGGFAAWQAAGLPTAKLENINAIDLRTDSTHIDRITILDVRSKREFAADHIEGAIHIPVGALPTRLPDVPKGKPIATICEGGYRSSLAASLLAREGWAPVFSVSGGMIAYRVLEAAAQS
jgi:hydroxyacylglutathione hydrolase